ncbi:MAG: DUF192 domain-containing protein [Longimicrobiales bacterium]|nr:DUF192 domain-containing protein [Longimicrobiales bacterium]
MLWNRRDEEAPSRRYGPRGSVTATVAAGALTVLLAGLASACSPQGAGGGTEMAVQASEARYADTLTSDRTPPRGHAWVIFGSDTVVAEVADSPSEHQEGLMHRQELPEGTGMLFVFQSESTRSFWMRDTFVPLDIAFLNQGMQVVDIQQMEPETEEYHTSGAPAMFALEVPQGWFEAHGIEPGAQAEIAFGPR